MKQDKMLEWIIGDNTGASSKTMWTAVMGIDTSNSPSYRCYTPSDASYFSRCLKLYNECELTQDDLAKASAMFPEWNGIIDNWKTLTDMYNSNHPDFHAYLRVLTK